ncbi:hypothetical protein [Flavobacterium cerinum]|uniref:Twin-arginine translocation signal domain-containing protein n=1 Tax=Flavobacterium cerinum TaxID=2502784 RepID=A0ABY5IP27_9FLAO|nr:hypothetical protein [Flavobacterium cerinum]UUC44592.1 hypothetical protein NOX80_13230 [Flavobacterium cerinum]
MNRRKFIKKTVLSSVLIGIGGTYVSCSTDSDYNIDSTDFELITKSIRKNKIFIVSSNNEKKVNNKLYYKNTLGTSRSIIVVGHIINTACVTQNMINNPNLRVKRYTDTHSIIEYNRPAEVKISENNTKHKLVCISEYNVLYKNFEIVQYTL